MTLGPKKDADRTPDAVLHRDLAAARIQALALAKYLPRRIILSHQQNLLEIGFCCGLVRNKYCVLQLMNVGVNHVKDVEPSVKFYIHVK